MMEIAFTNTVWFLDDVLHYIARNYGGTMAHHLVTLAKQEVLAWDKLLTNGE